MTIRPLSLDIVTPATGKPHLRIRAAGNRAILLASENYDEARSVAYAPHLLIEAIQSGAFVIRYVTETTPEEPEPLKPSPFDESNEPKREGLIVQ